MFLTSFTLKNVQKLEKRNKKIMVKTISKEQIKIKKIV